MVNPTLHKEPEGTTAHNDFVEMESYKQIAEYANMTLLEVITLVKEGSEENRVLLNKFLLMAQIRDDVFDEYRKTQALKSNKK